MLVEIGNKTTQGGHDMSSSSLQADQEEKKEETQEWAIEVYQGQEVDRVGAREEEDMLEFNLDEESEIPSNMWPLQYSTQGRATTGSFVCRYAKCMECGKTCICGESGRLYFQD
jgi:hypothetical protein